eukprot:163812-Prymnesium_polylepis.1
MDRRRRRASCCGAPCGAAPTGLRTHRSTRSPPMAPARADDHAIMRNDRSHYACENRCSIMPHYNVCPHHQFEGQVPLLRRSRANTWAATLQSSSARTSQRAAGPARSEPRHPLGSAASPLRGTFSPPRGRAAHRAA